MEEQISYKSTLLSWFEATTWEEKYAIIQKSIDNLKSELGIDEIVCNDSDVIKSIFTEGTPLFFHVGRLNPKETKNEENWTFKDLLAITAIQKMHATSKTKKIKLKKYLFRKREGIIDSNLPFEDITSNTYGLLLYREQAVELIVRLTGMTYEDAWKLDRNLRKILLEASRFGRKFVSLSVKNGFQADEAKTAWKIIRKKAQLRETQSNLITTCWVIYQIAYIKLYHTKDFNKLFLPPVVNIEHITDSIIKANNMSIPYPLEVLIKSFYNRV